jgi:lipopolysaccharide transport system permease protein
MGRPVSAGLRRGGKPSHFGTFAMSGNGSSVVEVLVIRPRSGLSPLDFKLLWQFRDLLVAFAERDIRLRYRQTALGAGWVILQPLLGASVFSVVFGLIAKIPSHGIPYFLISYSGLLGWTLLFGSITRMSPSLVANSSLIRRVFFPRLLVPLGVIPSVVLDFLVSTAVMIILMTIYRIAPTWGLLVIPICISSILAFAIGIGLLAASLAVRFRDIQHIVPFGIQLLMYASPVGYSVAAVPAKLQNYYLLFNPVAAPIDMIRWAFVGAGAPHFLYLGYSCVASIACLLIGLFTFRSFEREFADVI